MFLSIVIFRLQSSGLLFHFGEAGQLPGPDPERRNYNSFCSFQDPDGNTWLVQEVDRSKQP